ncbi:MULTISPECIES: N-acetyltransferase family protein [unclassified Moraxella]|uniref:GNAT family N-acetyltransferase n=1 Tax=unclassified Moraxella TaxID=2685852 RepID=UPI003AF94B2D
MSKNLSFHIRPANPTDLAQVVAIYNQSIASKQATADLTPVTVAERQAWFDNHSMDKRPLLVAVDTLKGNVIGWASFSDLYSRPAYHISAEIGLYIDDTAKGQGVGQELLIELLAIAPSCGIQQAVAKIFAHNQPSLGLFKKLGFEQWGVLKQVCDMDGFIADVVMMGKSLN